MDNPATWTQDALACLKQYAEDLHQIVTEANLTPTSEPGEDTLAQLIDTDPYVVLDAIRFGDLYFRIPGESWNNVRLRLNTRLRLERALVEEYSEATKLVPGSPYPADKWVEHSFAPGKDRRILKEITSIVEVKHRRGQTSRFRLTPLGLEFKLQLEEDRTKSA